MAGHNDLGKLGEAKAVEYLEAKGYVILERNWVKQGKEIDIVALLDNVLVFVEVKTRSSLEYGLPQEFVKHHKIKHLLTAADIYITMHDREEEVRFDIIAVYANEESFELEHLEDAFYFF
ncbi:YraN family protein [Myroides pelagicus]|uniref:YraN family protein n=1 Tax=Myroides pelagicus TaxID=270914 RepID=UPI002DBAAFDB|nr:YraN family protein [Myroides pelagicus]MEC4112744.1 YraN family protein [Myroides pelagicus]